MRTGGAIARVNADQTAFRSPPTSVLHPVLLGRGCHGLGPAGMDQDATVRSSGGAYQNYIDPDLQGWEQAYYGANLARLKQTRTRVDPDHYFQLPQAIGR